jgi:hypothetical protein
MPIIGRGVGRALPREENTPTAASNENDDFLGIPTKSNAQSEMIPNGIPG